MTKTSNKSSLPSTMEHGIYMSEVASKVGFIRILANNKGITEIRFYEQSIYDEFKKPVDNEITQQAKAQILEYLHKQRKVFDLPLAPQGTDFQQRVWKALCDIDHGSTASYLDVAKALNKPTACRAVGAANGKNPISIVIPCHRVIGTSGKLTGYAGGLSRKAFLLDLESE